MMMYSCVSPVESEATFFIRCNEDSSKRCNMHLISDDPHEQEGSASKLWQCKFVVEDVMIASESTNSDETFSIKL